MAREAKANEASCCEDKIIVTGAVIRHKTCEREEDETIVTFIKASGICSSFCRGLLCENSIKKS